MCSRPKRSFVTALHHEELSRRGGACEEKQHSMHWQRGGRFRPLVVGRQVFLCGKAKVWRSLFFGGTAPPSCWCAPPRPLPPRYRRG